MLNNTSVEPEIDSGIVYQVLSGVEYFLQLSLQLPNFQTWFLVRRFTLL